MTIERRTLRASDTHFPITEPLPDRPEVLHLEGAGWGALNAPRVAIVGTRAATPQGLADAHALGHWCARHGITVVSGMAIGIDGAAHAGALDGGGPSIGVIATGLDIEYPRRHATLYARMRAHGLIVTEAPLGTRPHAWRFPVRNRIIAALADAVVVIEATARGGARITADLALEYNRPVFALPGSRRNPAAEGCNALLADGAHPLLDPTDLLPTFGYAAAEPCGWDLQAAPPLSAAARAVLGACAGEPATADALAAQVGLSLPTLAGVLNELDAAGAIARRRGLVYPLTTAIRR